MNTTLSAARDRAATGQRPVSLRKIVVQSADVQPAEYLLVQSGKYDFLRFAPAAW